MSTKIEAEVLSWMEDVHVRINSVADYFFTKNSHFLEKLITRISAERENVPADFRFRVLPEVFVSWFPEF